MSTSPEEQRANTPEPPSKSKENTAELANDAAELAFFNNTDASRSELPAASDAKPETKAERRAKEEEDDEKEEEDKDGEGAS